MKINFIIEEDEWGNVIICFDGLDEDSLDEDASFNEIFLKLHISPFEFYSAFVKNGGMWDENLGYYIFKSYDDAAKTIDEIKSYSVLNKLGE